MGENLHWLKKEWLNSSKLLFMGANVHIGNSQRIYDKGVTTTIKSAFDTKGSYKSYSIAFIGLEGTFIRPTLQNKFTFSPYKGEGIEKTLNKLGLEYALVDLRNRSLSGQKFNTLAFNNTKVNTTWSEIYDCFIYTKTVSGCGSESQ